MPPRTTRNPARCGERLTPLQWPCNNTVESCPTSPTDETRPDRTRFRYLHRVRLSSVVWLGLGAGCSYRPTETLQPADGSSSTDGSVDAAVTDAAVDSEMLPTLVDRGLVVRYFMDEAASGTAPANLIDSAPSPLSVPISYGQASFIEENGNRGLHWPASQSTGKAETAFGSTKLISQLTPSSTVTIEVVAQITGAGTAGGGESQIAGLRGSNPDFMLTAIGSTDIRFFRPFGTEGGTWTNANNQQRMVLHLVFDSNRTNASDRIVLFRNGNPLAKSTGTAPNPGQTVGLGSSDDLMIGNRQGQDRSIAGTIFYVAFYKEALDATEIANNVERLLADDDQ
jgi:hypothetical protein